MKKQKSGNKKRILFDVLMVILILVFYKPYPAISLGIVTLMGVLAIFDPNRMVTAPRGRASSSGMGGDTINHGQAIGITMDRVKEDQKRAEEMAKYEEEHTP